MTGRFPSARLAVVLLLAVIGVLAAEHAAFAQKVLGIFGSGDTKYAAYRDSAGRFEIEQPAKDWGLVPPGGSAIAIFSRKDHTATLVVDLARLTEPLGENEITTNAQIEMDTLKEQQPNAKDFTSELLACKGGKGALIKYSRIGTKGAEKVLRYLIGVDRNLYRLDGVVQDPSATKYEPILMHMIQSFKAPAGPAATKN
ncbi:MAG TPA: hypothetical protein VKD69_04535 [Vicinamibacterales bacterium]|nr:hypothetical protein [Vicinamibacterales bacterium]